MANFTTHYINPFDQSHQSPSITFIQEDCHLFTQIPIRYTDVGFYSKLDNLSPMYNLCLLITLNRLNLLQIGGVFLMTVGRPYLL
jgi:hypothetical protein